jgi:hypothetical protein
MRYIYFIEGAVFLAIGSYAATRIGFGGLLTTSILGSLAFSCSYGIWRTTREFDLSLKEVLFRWLTPPAQLFVLLGLFALLLYWPTRDLPAKVQLPLYVVVTGSVGIFLFLRYGLGPELRHELQKRTPDSVSRLLERFLPI